MGYLKLISGGGAIGALIGLFLVLSEQPKEFHILLLPSTLLLPIIIVGFIGLVCGSILSAIAAAVEKSALDGKPMARFVYFGILGALGGSLLAIPLASTMNAGTGGDTVVVRAIVILLLMFLGGGSAAAVGVLTRKSKPGEKFLPWQDSLTEPTKPTLTIVATVLAVLVGNARRALMLFQPNSQGLDAILVVSIIAWFLIAYVIIRFALNNYHRKLAAYRDSKSKDLSLNEATSKP